MYTIQGTTLIAKTHPHVRWSCYVLSVYCIGMHLMLLPVESRSVNCAKGPAQHSQQQQPLSELKIVVARQKQRETKKFSKAVQAERTKEKAQQKKANISDITRLRKQRQKSVSLHLKSLSVPINMLLASDSSTGPAFCCLNIALL